MGNLAQERVCYRCRLSQPSTEFYVEAERRRGVAAGRGGPVTFTCRSCASEIAAARMRPRRAIIDAAKLAGCTDCGLSMPDHPEVFDFDHIPGTDKRGPVSAFLTKGTVDDLRAEIAKCEVVCSNCHRIRTKSRPPVTRGRSRI